MASHRTTEEKALVLARMRRTLADDPEVLGIFVFGSYARGDSRSDSDIDLLVVRSGPFRKEIVERDGVEFEMFLNNEEDTIEFWRANADDFENFWADAQVLFDRDGVTDRLRAAAEGIRGMSDHPPDRARKVMGLARQEALRLGHDYIGPEHILLGLVRESSGTVPSVLRALGVDLEEIVCDVEKGIGKGTEPITRGQLPFTPAAKSVLERSLDEATQLGHAHLGTGHLLLGLLGEGEGLVAEALLNLGVRLKDARLEVTKILRPEQ